MYRVQPPSAEDLYTLKSPFQDFGLSIWCTPADQSESGVIEHTWFEKTVHPHGDHRPGDIKVMMALDYKMNFEMILNFSLDQNVGIKDPRITHQILRQVDEVHINGVQLESVSSLERMYDRIQFFDRAAKTASRSATYGHQVFSCTGSQLERYKKQAPGWNIPGHDPYLPHSGAISAGLLHMILEIKKRSFQGSGATVNAIEAITSSIPGSTGMNEHSIISARSCFKSALI